MSEFDKFDKEIFKNVIEFHKPSDASKLHGDIYKEKFNIGCYSYDYRHSIIYFYKASGCEIIWSGMQCDNVFEIKYKSPCKLIEVDIDDYANNYKGGYWLDSHARGLIFIVILFLIVLITEVLSNG